MPPLRLLAPVALALFATPAFAEVCIDKTGGQYADKVRICVSSVLAPQGDNKYGPENLGAEGAVAWCEGAPGPGQGEYIRLIFSNVVSFKTLVVGNGYAKSKTAFFNNARARTVRIETGDGLRFTAVLKDFAEPQKIRLPRVAKTREVRITIVNVYGGDKHKDLCMHYFSPNLEEIDIENQ